MNLDGTKSVLSVFAAFTSKKGDNFPIVRLTKLDNAENAKYPAGHPRHIKAGAIFEGLMLRPVAVGQSFYVDFPTAKNHAHTSVVQEILSENTFKTKNSIYKWEIINKE